MQLIRVAMLAIVILCRPMRIHGQDSGDRAVPREGIVRTVDLNIGESQTVALADGAAVSIKLVALNETRDGLRDAVRESVVTVEISGQTFELKSGPYRLPLALGGVQIDCPVTRGYTLNARNGTVTAGKANAWGLRKDVRLRLWPVGSAWMSPGTFRYPLRQRWFASDTHMSNEPTFVNGDERIGGQEIYYHYGLDFGGAEGMVEVVAATDGLVVSAAGDTLPDHADSPARRRYDVIYIVDERGWYYRYSHLKTIDVRAGQRVQQGQRLGLLGKEGGSGGWSHLHFDVTTRQPSGNWGIHDAYAYVWEAYRREYAPPVIAVARPHRLAAVGQSIELDASQSWSSTGTIDRCSWRFTDGSTATGGRVERTYSRPGTYSEVVRVADTAGHESIDFAVVQVLDPHHPDELPPAIHAACSPTLGIRPGDDVTFKVRTFRTTDGSEVWDFGDGSPPVEVRSDGAVKLLAKDGYAVTTHRYAREGTYVARVQRSNRRGETATAHLVITVERRE
ncbi:putative peptidase [Caulifigura coniformis]|uniref:Putative peptidase n=1 Tax=Caulifigura coniformis TaxID=2527983 RepID=A0A517SIF7_9PLAN|nr:PKD domain-containing protein [Caulifigura coniformis]QDT55900.1 putative peptidase [Caulifigura coniformis]